MSTPESILKEIFGYDTFRPYQREVIENVLARRDTLAVMPTGGGKSLCYQIPALLFPGICVVVSPLIALMKDQTDQLRANGVAAVCLHSALSLPEYQQNIHAVRSGKAMLLYLAPETLLSERILNLLDDVRVDMLTIDEAHCISEWGHDFRPEYRQLADVRRRFPTAVCLAMTATATARVRADIKKSLDFTASNEFVASFDRENLYIEVSPKQDPSSQVLNFLGRFQGQSGIIYCFSRKQVDSLAEFLNKHGHSVRPYHAGLADDVRRTNQEAFIRDDVRIIAATIAFGMGINKPDVRFVVHYDLPKSIEGYYQEIGRAGRDGLPAHCLLLYSYADVNKLRYFIRQKEQSDERLAAEQHLRAIVRYAEEKRICRRRTLLAYFGEQYGDAGTASKCENCDNCKAPPPVLEDITIPAQKFLSCVKRTGECFSADYVTDVLLGVPNSQILANAHDKLSTYSIGHELAAEKWLELGDYLLKTGLLSASKTSDSGLALTSKAWEHLKNRTKIYRHCETVAVSDASQQVKKKSFAHNIELFELLRKKRKALADEAQLPPYVIFSDKTLIEMAFYYPQTASALLKIYGVGKAKLHDYGDAFLEVIVAFCLKNGLKPRERKAETLTEMSKGQPSKPPKPRYIEAGEAYNSGISIKILMERYSVIYWTVISHLMKFVVDGNILRRGDDLLEMATSSPEERQRAFAAFERLGTTHLKPVFEELGGSLSYEELSILRLYSLSQDIKSDKTNNRR